VGANGHDRPCGNDRDRQPARSAAADVMFVDAPVSGSKGPAEAGQLLILASGPPAAAAAVRPVFSAIGRKTVWLGEAGQGSRMKLVVNAYMSILIEGVAEALELAGRLGIDDSSWPRPSRAARWMHRSRTPSCTRWSGRFRARVPAGVGAQGRRPGPGRRRRDRAPAAGRAVSPVACCRGRRPRTRRRQRCPPGAKRGPDRVSTPTV
jgi:3-hydroxyisobutyrate dehydrogenase and related beta-hydroxyacid dehydrogenases